MSLEIYEGTVSHANAGTNVHGNISTSAITGKTSGSVSSSNTYTFRVAGKPAAFSCSGSVSISDGDYVIVGGKIKKGQLEVHALKNVTTSAQYTNYSVFNTVFAWALILFGLATAVVIVGIPLFICGVWLLIISKAGKQAVKLVQEAVPMNSGAIKASV